MNRGLLLRLLLCIFVLALFLYSYLNKQNDLTGLKIQIPKLSKELKQICEENLSLRYKIDQFESPRHLIELSRQKEFSHLKAPYENEVIIIEGEEKEHEN